MHDACATPLTTEALRLIAKPYVIEADPGQAVLRATTNLASSIKRLLDDLELWLRTTLDTVSRKSDTATTILYALKLWAALLCYCDDGAIGIRNSAAGRALNSVAIGRTQLSVCRRRQQQGARYRDPR